MTVASEQLKDNRDVGRRTVIFYNNGIYFLKSKILTIRTESTDDGVPLTKKQN